MYMCYLDESGVQENTGTSHFVLVGLAVVAEEWKKLESQIAARKQHYGVADAEIHSAWVARRYVEQERIPNFERLPWSDRRQLLRDLADCIAGWQEARLFAEVLDKGFTYGSVHPYSPFEFAFTELVQRYEYFLRNRGNFLNQTLYGFIIQDNNDTIAKRLTSMMRKFHAQGTRWTGIDHIIETPFFVDSHLTSMVQMADLCGYATRRFFENNEVDLFNRVYPRFDRVGQGVVGIRHFTIAGCRCQVCRDHP